MDTVIALIALEESSWLGRWLNNENNSFKGENFSVVSRDCTSAPPKGWITTSKVHVLYLPQKTLLGWTMPVKTSLDPRNGDSFLFLFLIISLFNSHFSSYFSSALVHYQEFSFALTNPIRQPFGVVLLSLTPREFLNLSWTPAALGWFRL